MRLPCVTAIERPPRQSVGTLFSYSALSFSLLFLFFLKNYYDETIRILTMIMIIKFWLRFFFDLIVKSLMLHCGGQAARPGKRTALGSMD